MIFPTNGRRRRRRRRSVYQPEEIVPPARCWSSFHEQEGQWFLFLGHSGDQKSLSLGGDDDDDDKYILKENCCNKMNKSGKNGNINSNEEEKAGRRQTARNKYTTDSEANRRGWKESSMMSFLALLRSELSILPRGVWIHLTNALIATLLLVWFISYDYYHANVPTTTIRTTTTSSAPTYISAAGAATRRSMLWIIYLSQLGIIYDNGVNASGRYIGEGRFLRLLHKYRFVWHVTAMPLLAIPVTEIAMRQSFFCDTRTQNGIVFLAASWALIDFIRWSLFQDPQKLRLVDVRSSPTNQGIYLSGTLRYASDAVWEMILPPVLLILYELIIGSTTILRWGFAAACSQQQQQDEGAVSFSTTTAFMGGSEEDATIVLAAAASSTFWPATAAAATALDLTADAEGRVGGLFSSSFCVQPPTTSAIWLMLSGMLTLWTSGVARGYPELQLLGENLHGLLLWAAYIAVD